MVIKFFLNLQQGKLRKVPEISDIQDAYRKEVLNSNANRSFGKRPTIGVLTNWVGKESSNKSDMTLLLRICKNAIKNKKR